MDGKIAKGIVVLGKARKCFKNDFMMNLHNAYIYPYLMYCNQIWGSTYRINFSKLKVLQNKTVRIVTGSPPRRNNENMYRCSGIVKNMEQQMSGPDSSIGLSIRHESEG